MSDRVVVLSAGPASRPIGEFTIDLDRPRDVAEVRTTPRFIELHDAIWAVLRDEVLKGYAQQLMPHPRSAFGAPPHGGDASGPAKPVPRRPLGTDDDRRDPGAADTHGVTDHSTDH
jgi:hypothetical protein